MENGLTLFMHVIIISVIKYTNFNYYFINNLWIWPVIYPVLIWKHPEKWKWICYPINLSVCIKTIKAFFFSCQMFGIFWTIASLTVGLTFAGDSKSHFIIPQTDLTTFSVKSKCVKHVCFYSIYNGYKIEIYENISQFVERKSVIKCY